MGMLDNLPVPHEDGSFVNANVSRIAEMVKEYDPNIDVRWVPPGRRNPGDAAFAFVTRDMQGKEYVMFYVQEEKDMDASVLARIFQMDAAKHGNIMTTIDANNAAVRAEQARIREERELERLDVAQTILKSPLHTFKHNGKIYD